MSELLPDLPQSNTMKPFYNNIVFTVHRISYKNKVFDGLSIEDIFFASYDVKDPVIELIDVFTTFDDQRILGVEMEEASVYGSKAKISFEDPDRVLANRIDKHDVVNMYVVDPDKVSLTSLLFNSTKYFGTAGEIVDEGVDAVTKISPQLKSILEKTEPKFSGIVTKIGHKSGNSAQLHVDVEGFVRILQQMNIEKVGITNDAVFNPKLLDSYLLSFPEIELKDTQVSFRDSKILNTIASSFLIHANDNYGRFVGGDPLIDYEKIDTLDEMEIDDVKMNKVYVHSFSSNLIMVRMSPMSILHFFLKYINRQINWLMFFDVKLTIDDELKEILKDVERMANNKQGNIPLLTFMIKLQSSDDVDDRLGLFNQRKYFDREIHFVFSEISIDELLLDEIPEQYLLHQNRLILSQKTNQNTIQQYIMLIFINMLNLSNQSEFIEEVSIELNGDPYIQYFLKTEKKDEFLKIISMIKKIYRQSISFDTIINNNKMYIRSTSYEGSKNQDSDMPITQFIQTLISSMFYVPVKYSNAIGGSNLPYDVVQRIWIQSKIKSRLKNGNKLRNYLPNTRSLEGIFKKIPVIEFKVKMAKPIKDDNILNDTVLGTKALGFNLNQILEYNFMDLPKEGYVGLYRNFSATTKENGKLFDLIFQPKGSLLSNGNLYAGNLFVVDLDEVYREFGFGGRRGGRYRAINHSVLSEMKTSELLFHKNPIPRLLSLHVALGSVSSIRDKLGEIYNFYDIDGFRKNIHLGYNVKGIKNDTLYNLGNPSIGTSRMEVFTTEIDIGGKKLDISSSIDLADLSSDEEDRDFGDYFTEGDTPFYTTGGSDYIVTGLIDYIDILAFLKPYKVLRDFMEEGYDVYNPLGNVDFYKESKILSLIDFDITSFIGIRKSILDDQDVILSDNIDNSNIHEYDMFELVDAIYDWLNRIDKDDDYKQYIKMRYATTITVIPADYDYIDDNDNLNIANLQNGKVVKTINTQNPSADNTMKVLASIFHSVVHYIFKISKMNSIGGVMYLDTSSYIDTNNGFLEIGDAIYFKDELKLSSASNGNSLLNVIDKLKNTLEDINSTFIKREGKPLSLRNKVFYIWKIIHYFGGSETSAGSTSGSTQRVYLTDSTIHWHHSYEDDGLMTRIAESLRVQGLPNPIRG